MVFLSISSPVAAANLAAHPHTHLLGSVTHLGMRRWSTLPLPTTLLVTLLAPWPTPQAKQEFERNEAKKEAVRLRKLRTGEDTWTAPGLDRRLGGGQPADDSSKRKRHKEKKSKHKSKKDKKDKKDKKHKKHKSHKVGGPLLILLSCLRHRPRPCATFLRPSVTMLPFVEPGPFSVGRAVLDLPLSRCGRMWRVAVQSPTCSQRSIAQQQADVTAPRCTNRTVLLFLPQGSKSSKSRGAADSDSSSDVSAAAASASKHPSSQ